MSCPAYIWVPLMAAALPFTRAVRDRLDATKYRLFGGSADVTAVHPDEL